MSKEKNFKNWAFVVIGIVAIAGAQAEGQSDTFDGTVIDTTKWEVAQSSGSPVTQNDALFITMDGSPVPEFTDMPGAIGRGVGIRAWCKLSGDFDIQVDFSDYTPVPNYDFTQMFFGIYQDATHGLHIKRITASYADGIQTVYTTNGTNRITSGGIEPFPDWGTFRIVRNSSTISTYYYGATGWVHHFSTSSVFPDDVVVTLTLGHSHPTEIASVVLDNYIINSGTLVCPSENIIYVDDTASGSNDGSSWANAYNYLQDALAAASSGDEIWVAQGIYRPNQGIIWMPGDKTPTFQLINGVAIYGGFNGSETNLGGRDTSLYETILSGDLNGDDAPVSDPVDLLTEPTCGENSYNVVTGGGTDATAVIDGFTVTAGNGGKGAGMFNRDGSPTVKNCTFITNAGFAAGAMWNERSTLVLTKCVFTGNVANDGGAMINSESNLTLTNCEFTNNKALREQAGGGAMANAYSDIVLTNCTFSNNSAPQLGGAIFGYGNTYLVTNCTFKNNSSYYGGGIYVYPGETWELTSCIFENNSAEYVGGGVYSSVCENLSFESCTFSENTAVHSGGGADIGDGTATLTNCTFNQNSADIGGGIQNFRNIKLTLTNCTFNNNSARMGGGISNGWGEATTTTLTGCSFNGNTANSGAGIYNSYYSSPSLTDCTFTANSAISNGGGICNFYNCSPDLTNCTFTDNTAPWGAGIDNGKDCSPTLASCSFEKNIATSSGGGISNYDNCHPVLNNCIFSENSANSGAGIYSSTSSPTVNNCIFENNNSVGNGGAMSNGSSYSLVTNCIFKMNTAEYGGAISNIDWSDLPSSPTLINCIFSNNSATNGGVFSNMMEDPAIINCTLFQNSATNGNAVWNHYGSEPSFVNCIIWDGDNEVFDTDIGYDDITWIDYSDVQGGWPGTGNIDADPKFVDSANDDFHLQPDSPCIDAGDSSAVPTDILYDLDGNPRILGTAVDMGVYELSNVAPIAIITLPSSGFVEAVDVPIQFTGDIIDPDTGDTHTAIWTISNENWTEDYVFDGTVTGLTISDEFPFIEAGIYSIKLTVTDSHDESDETTTVNNDSESPAFVVIYNPDGGFVTGGGWIYSPAGALLDSSAEGKANFGFVAKYKKGANVPTGNTEFRFQAGDFRFKSNSYDWLVVAGKKAMFKGEGSIDGMDGSFKFMLTGVDDTEDKFRIKISDPASENPIYDNKRGEGDEAEPTVIGGGSIVIHKQ